MHTAQYTYCLTAERFDTEMKLFKANKRFLERENKIDEIPAILVFNNKKTKILYDMNKIEVDDFF